MIHQDSFYRLSFFVCSALIYGGISVQYADFGLRFRLFCFLLTLSNKSVTAKKKGGIQMKKTIRILCVIGAVLAMSGTASCGDKKANENTVSESVQISLKTADINIADNFSSIRCIDMSSPQSILIFGQLVT